MPRVSQESDHFLL